MPFHPPALWAYLSSGRLSRTANYHQSFSTGFRHYCGRWAIDQAVSGQIADSPYLEKRERNLQAKFDRATTLLTRSMQLLEHLDILLGGDETPPIHTRLDSLKAWTPPSTMP
jgi:hypothetical protein